MVNNLEVIQALVAALNTMRDSTIWVEIHNSRFYIKGDKNSESGHNSIAGIIAALCVLVAEHTNS